MDKMPIETVSEIILHVPEADLKNISKQLPKNDPLRHLIDSDIYAKVYVGPYDYSILGFHKLSIEEFQELSLSGNTDVIRSLKYDAVFSEVDDDPFLFYCKQNPRSLKDVKEIEFNGSVEQFRKFAANFSTDNVKVLILSEGQQFVMDLAPPYLRKIHLYFYESQVAPLRGWPQSLKTLIIERCNSPLLVELPAGLEELLVWACGSEEPWNQYPPNLRILEYQGEAITFNSSPFPDLLCELALFDCSIENLDVLQAKWPMGLKKLDLARNPIKSIAGVKFPDSLDFLNLRSCSITSLDGVTFPRMLTELHLTYNEIASLDHVKFPALKILDITGDSGKKTINSLASVQFPSTLETLQAKGHPITDWAETSVPENLRTWELDTSEDAKALKFPPGLEVLTLKFKNAGNGNFCDLKLPPSLVDLHLENGISTEFEWNLPVLRNMFVDNFTGPIVVPSCVQKLTLRSQDRKSFESLKIPPMVDVLQVTYPPKVYPDSVTELLIWRFEPTGDLILPKFLKKLRIASRGSIPSDVILPSTLRYISGPFDQEIMEEINSRKE